MILDRILGRRADQLAIKRGPWALTDSSVVSLFGSNESTSGATVDMESTLSLSAVFAGVNLYSLVLASLPLVVHRRGQDGTKQLATNHPVYRLLHTAPNPEMTAFTFRRVLEWHRLLGGAACAEIEWGEDGEPVAIWPIESWRVRPDRDEDGNLFYRIDGNYIAAPDDIIYIPLISFDGVCGRSFIDFAIESLGLALTAQEFAGEFFGNGARPSGLLEHPGNTTKEARAEMRKAWTERHAKGGVLGMIWGGWKYDATAGGEGDMEKAQLLESRRFVTEEVARWLNIPPHLLRDLSRATFSNIEAQQRDALTYSFGPVLIGYEQEYDRRLLPAAVPGVEQGYYTKHKLEGFLRADSAARASFYNTLAGIGVLSINDILDLEDRNSIGPMGDKRFVPLNMQTLEDATKPKPVEPPAPPAPAPEPKPEPAPPEEPKEDPTLRAWLTDTLERLMRVEVNAALRAVKEPGKFLAWIDEFYPAHVRKVDEAMGVPLKGKAYKGRWVRDSIESLMELSGRATAKTLAAEAETLFKQWEARPAAEAARIMEKLRCRE